MGVRILTSILYDAIIVIIILFITIYLVIPLLFPDNELLQLKNSLKAVCENNRASRDFHISLKNYDLLFKKGAKEYTVSILLCDDYKIYNNTRYRENCKVVYELDCGVSKVVLKSESTKIKSFTLAGKCYSIYPKPFYEVQIPKPFEDLICIPIGLHFTLIIGRKYISSVSGFSQKDSFALGDYCYIDYCKYDACGENDDILTKEITGILTRQDDTLYVEIYSAK
ncbi:MAG TPA: hypothetical protein EYH22_03575 [Candidatus Nanopusillus sp.]|nr:hypothetical protein [Candidatus Nanopusillus sp.]